MSGAGYFDRIGARVEAMSQAPEPLPMVERLTMAAPAEMEPAIHREAEISTAQEATPNSNRFNMPADPAPVIPTVETHFVEADPDYTGPAAPTQETTDLAPDPHQQRTMTKETLIAPELAPLDPPAQTIEPPAKPLASVEVPQPHEELTSDTAARDLTPDSPPPKAPVSDAEADDRAEEAPTKELAPEEHIALFEQYIDKLNGRETPPPDIQPQPKPQATTSKPSEPPPRKPALEIGEITVEVQAPRAVALPNVSAKTPRRGPPRAMQMQGRRSGLRPM